MVDGQQKGKECGHYGWPNMGTQSFEGAKKELVAKKREKGFRCSKDDEKARAIPAKRMEKDKRFGAPNRAR